MNQTKLLSGVLLAASLPAGAATITQDFNAGFANGGTVADGNLVPWSDTRPIMGAPGETITSVLVKLYVAGGYNGDLYGYLSYGGQTVPLLNRVGVGSGDAFGYADAGLYVTFNDAASDDIHFYQNVGGWTIANGAAWQPDGRLVNPVTGLPAEFDALGTRKLSVWNGADPTGDWTLVLSDVVLGGGAATVQSWGLQITTAPVPEPGTWAMLVVTAGGVCGHWLRPRRRGRSGQPPRRS